LCLVKLSYLSKFWGAPLIGWLEKVATAIENHELK
jgi:hypothetical protein